MLVLQLVAGDRHIVGRVAHHWAIARVNSFEQTGTTDDAAPGAGGSAPLPAELGGGGGGVSSAGWFTVYVISVQTLDGKRWELKKRYSDYDTLYQKLKRRPECKGLPFPGKTLGRLTLAQQEKRYAGLLVYAQCLARVLVC